MSDAKGLVDALAVENGDDLFRHVLEPEGRQIVRLVRAAVAEEVGGNDTVAAGAKVLDLVAPVERRRRKTMEKE